MQDQRGSRAAQVLGYGIVGCHGQRGWDAGLAIGCSPADGGKLRHFYLQMQDVRVPHPDVAWQSNGCFFLSMTNDQPRFIPISLRKCTPQTS
jgi:hypothetical protein